MAAFCIAARIHESFHESFIKDFTDILDPTLHPPPRSSFCCLPRYSADHKICMFGKAFLQLCQDSDLCILNGRVHGDFDGKYTCHIDKGSSVVDYFVTSSIATAAVESMSVLGKQAESNHCPLTLKLALQAVPAADSAIKKDCHSSATEVHVQKIKYNLAKVEQYREELQHRLDAVYNVPEHQCCLVTALQACNSRSHTFAPCSKGHPEMV